MTESDARWGRSFQSQETQVAFAERVTALGTWGQRRGEWLDLEIVGESERQRSRKVKKQDKETDRCGGGGGHQLLKRNERPLDVGAAAGTCVGVRECGLTPLPHLSVSPPASPLQRGPSGHRWVTQAPSLHSHGVLCQKRRLASVKAES